MAAGFQFIAKECKKDTDCRSEMACKENKCVSIETTTLNYVTTEDSVTKKGGKGLSKTIVIVIAAIAGVAVICGAVALIYHKKRQGNSSTENVKFAR